MRGTMSAGQRQLWQPLHRDAGGAAVVCRMLRLSTSDNPNIDGHLVPGGGYLCLLLANTE